MIRMTMIATALVFGFAPAALALEGYDGDNNPVPGYAATFVPGGDSFAFAPQMRRARIDARAPYASPDDAPDARVHDAPVTRRYR